MTGEKRRLVRHDHRAPHQGVGAVSLGRRIGHLEDAAARKRALRLLRLFGERNGLDPEELEREYHELEARGIPDISSTAEEFGMTEEEVRASLEETRRELDAFAREIDA